MKKHKKKYQSLSTVKGSIRENMCGCIICPIADMELLLSKEHRDEYIIRYGYYITYLFVQKIIQPK